MTEPIKLTYEEREAVQVLRKSVQRGRTQVLQAVFADLSKETIGSVLLSAKTELNNNLKAVQALQAATAKLMEELK